jgi:hypothetical protein
MARSAQGKRPRDHRAADIVSDRKRRESGGTRQSGTRTARRARTPCRGARACPAQCQASSAALVRDPGGLDVVVVLGTAAGLWSCLQGWRNLMTTRAQFIAGIVEQQTGKSDHVGAMLIGLDALPDKNSKGIRQRVLRPEMSVVHASTAGCATGRRVGANGRSLRDIPASSGPSRSRPTARAC